MCGVTCYNHVWGYTLAIITFGGICVGSLAIITLGYICVGSLAIITFGPLLLAPFRKALAANQR